MIVKNLNFFCWSNQFVILFIGNFIVRNCGNWIYDLIAYSISYILYLEITNMRSIVKQEKLVDICIEATINETNHQWNLFWFLFTLLYELPACQRQFDACNFQCLWNNSKCARVLFRSFFKFMIKVVRAHGNYRTQVLYLKKKNQISR